MDRNEQIQMEEFKELKRHQEILLDIQSVLATKPGRNLMRFLFERFGVGDLPEIGISDEYLKDRLGFLRAGQLIFKIVAEAHPETAGSILAQIERDRHVQAHLEV